MKEKSHRAKRRCYRVVSGHFEALTRGGSMATACITHSALKVHGISKPIIARFDQPQASSDGGAILIQGGRRPTRADVALGQRHSRSPAARPRSRTRSGICCVSASSGWPCGYADCKRRRGGWSTNPIHKLLLERDPPRARPWAAADAVAVRERRGRADLYRLGRRGRHRAVVPPRASGRPRAAHHDRPRRHGRSDPRQQELALFNGYYDTWCYLRWSPP